MRKCITSVIITVFVNFDSSSAYYYSKEMHSIQYLSERLVNILKWIHLFPSGYHNL